MTEDEIRTAFTEELSRIAPDVSPADVTGDAHLLDDLDLDSMDVLNLVTALGRRFDISIPEFDYRRLETPDKAVAYLAAKTGA